MLVAVFTFLYSAASILRHDHFGTNGFDLGIFDQAIWHYSAFEAPASTIRGFDNLLGDHFHPILALAAPAFWIRDDVRSLLVLQALLVAASSLPVYWLASEWFGARTASLWSLAYLFFWGLQRAITFNFHEIAFAVPLIAFALYFLLKERYGIAAGLILSLLLVKEDLSFLVAAFALVYFFKRRWRLGAVLLSAAAVWLVVAVKVLIPFFAHGRHFRYWTYSQYGSDPLNGFVGLFRHPRQVYTDLQWPRVKLELYGWIFVPFACLSALSPLFVLTIPLLAERVLSTNASYWVRGNQYSATIAPIVAMSALDSLRRVRKWTGASGRRLPVAVGLAVLAMNMWPATESSREYFPIRVLFEPSYWTTTESDRLGDELVSLVPPEASVIAQDTIAPHLTHRDRVYLLYPPWLRRRVQESFFDAAYPDTRIDFVAANFRTLCFPLSCREPGYENADNRRYLGSLSGQGYGLVYSQGSWLLFHRGSPSTALLSPEARQYFGRDITSTP